MCAVHPAHKSRHLQRFARLKRLCKKPSIGMPCGKPNPLNPPYQGDFLLNSPLIRGARGVRNDEILSFCTVSKSPLLSGALLPTPNPRFSIQKIIGSGTLPIFAPAKSAYGRHGWRKCRLRRSSYCVPYILHISPAIYNGLRG